MQTQTIESLRRPPQFRNEKIQQVLSHWNRTRLAPQFPEADWRAHFELEAEMHWLEAMFLEELPAEVAAQSA